MMALPAVSESVFLFVLSLGVAVATFGLIFALTPLATRLNLVDKPDHRKFHNASVPVLGGIAIYLVMILSVLVLDLTEYFTWLMLAASILVAIGIMDDACGLGVRTRFASQILATGLMIVGESVWIRSFGFELFGVGSGLGWIGMLMTIVVVVGLTNGFNMVDGIDGLASGHMLIGLGTMSSILFITHGSVYQSEWILLISISVSVFFLINLSLTPLRKVFLGDAGSLLLGFVMAWMLIYYTQEPISLINPVAALWCVTIPVFDTVVVIARRVKNKRSPFFPDRNHLHYRLLDMGVNQHTVLVGMLSVSFLVNAFGCWITYAISPLVSLVVYCTFLFGFGYAMLHPSIERRLALTLRLID